MMWWWPPTVWSQKRSRSRRRRLRNLSKKLMMWWEREIYLHQCCNWTCQPRAWGWKCSVWSSVLFQSATALSSSSASDLGPSDSGRSPQHQKPQSADLHGRVSAEGSCPLGRDWHAHPEQPAGHVLTAQVRAIEPTSPGGGAPSSFVCMIECLFPIRQVGW